MSRCSAGTATDPGDPGDPDKPASPADGDDATLRADRISDAHARLTVIAPWIHTRTRRPRTIRLLGRASA